jgi:hypothetical protein
LIVDALRGHGGTTLGVVANIGRVSPDGRDILGFISYGYAEALLRLDRIEEYLLFLYAHRYHAHTRGSWVAGEVSGITGDLALFCIPAQLTMPKLVRWMLVYEDPDRDCLYLGRAVPHSWILSGAAISVEDVPTRWGLCGFTLQRDGADRIVGEVRLPPAAPRETRLRLRLPSERRIRSVQVDGRPHPLQGSDIVLRAAGGRARHILIQIV